MTWLNRISKVALNPIQILRMALHHVILGILIATVGGILFDGLSTELARLMALSVTPLIGMRLLLPATPLNEQRAVFAAAIGSGGAFSAIGGGLLAPPLLALQIAVAVFGAMTVMLAAGLRRQQRHEARWLTRQLRVHQDRNQALEQSALTLSGAAHDINNLLTVVSGAAELIQLRGGLPTAAKRDLDRIARAAEQARAMGQDLLDTTRQQVTPDIIDLRQAAKDLEAVLDDVLGDRVKLILDLPKTGVTAKITGCAIKQILLNLVSNARDAGAKTVTVTLKRDRCGAVLAVKDDGTGMDPCTLQQALLPFFTTKHTGKGNGMGLHTVEALARNMGGGLQIQSRRGIGTTIQVLLP
ncbi:MAG: HAMP domain-containing sensor histidine kinase [Myxococcota bacterium]